MRSFSVDDGFGVVGGLHRIVQGPSVDILICPLDWAEQLNQGDPGWIRVEPCF